MENFKNFYNLLTRFDKIMICGHENPDPDSVCSCIALEYLFDQFDKEVVAVLNGTIEPPLKKMDYRNILVNLDDFKIPEQLNEYLLIIVDTNDVTNIGDPLATFIDEVSDYYIIDHHLFHQIPDPDNFLIEPNASSTCEIIFRLYAYFKIIMPKEVGDAIYTGIYFDTGSFNYSKTTAATFKIITQLVENGTNPNDIFLSLTQIKNIEDLRLLTYVLKTIEFYHSDQIALLYLTRKMLLKSGAHYEYAADLVNMPLNYQQVKVSVFFKEKLDGTKKVSLRSKGNIDVAQIAFQLGGGGHKNAAGFKIKHSFYSIARLKKIILKQLDEQL